MVTSFNITMKSRTDVRTTCCCSFFYLYLGLVQVCEIEISQMVKNNGNPDHLVCEKLIPLFLPMLDNSIHIPVPALGKEKLEDLKDSKRSPDLLIMLK